MKAFCLLTLYYLSQYYRILILFTRTGIFYLFEAVCICYRDAFWPNGILAETVPRRDKAIRMRTRVAGKTKLLEVMPGKQVFRI